MKFMKKYFSIILVVVVLAGVMAPMVAAAGEVAIRTLIEEDFEQAERPATLTYHEGSGSIQVKDIGASRALHLENGSDGSYTLITKNFGKITDGFLVFETKFLQPDAKVDNNIILEVLSDDNVVLSIVTESGNISAKMSDGSYVTLVSGYFSDKWYELRAELDLTNGYCDYYVNDTLKAENLNFITSANSADTVSSYARYMPGFYLDDFSAYNEIPYNALSVAGNAKAAIPQSGETSYVYTASLVSGAGNNISGENLVWSLSGDSTGVRLEESTDGMQATIFVSSAATNGGTVTVTVTSQGGSLSANKNVALESLVATEIKILGDARVSAYAGKRTTFTYSASVFDQLGNKIPDQSLIWEITNNSCATMSLDNDGVLTVSGKMPDKDEKAVIKVSLANDLSVFGTKSILVQRYDTYFNDKQRLEAAITGVDNIIKAASNPDGRNPLMGTFISPYTNSYGYWNLEGIKTPTACSSLSEQFELMRSMDGITNLTGDESYSERVRDIYQWHIDHGISKNGLVYWGNHTTMDLETGKWAEYFEKYALQHPYVEVKDRDLYMDPFFELDPTVAANICKDQWCGIIKDWTTLSFNRHAIINNTKGPDYSGWNNKEGFLEYPNADDPNDPWVRTQDLPFSSSAAGLISFANIAYEETGDPDFLFWATKLIKRYVDTKDPDTDIFGYIFTSTQRMPGRFSLEETFGPIWWSQPRENIQGSQYGDRAFNQFSHMLISGGYITAEEAEYEVLEGILMSNDSTPLGSAFFIEVMYLADTMLKDADPAVQAQGKQIIIDFMKCLSSYVDIGYNEEQNNFHKMLANGTILDGILWTRPGYWGSAGKSFSPDSVGTYHMDTLLRTYIMASRFPELNNECQIVWDCARKICDKTYHMGDIGDPILGERPDLNLATNTTNTEVLRALLQLYEASGWEEYLTMARIVGNNIVAGLFKEGYFIENSSLQYINTDGEYPYVLLKLEAYLRGEPDLVPDSMHKNHLECEAVFRDERNALKSWNRTPLEGMTYPSVFVKELRVNTNNLQLKLGEGEKVQVTIIPDDASSKAIYWDIRDKDIVSVTADNTFIPMKEGETVAYAVSRSSLGVVSEPIHITVSR